MMPFFLSHVFLAIDNEGCELFRKSLEFDKINLRFQVNSTTPNPSLIKEGSSTT